MKSLAEVYYDGDFLRSHQRSEKRNAFFYQDRMVRERIANILMKFVKSKVSPNKFHGEVHYYYLDLEGVQKSIEDSILPDIPEGAESPAPLPEGEGNE